MSTSVPSSMKACQYTSVVGGLEKNLTINRNAALPKGADSLGKDQTLVNVKYSSLNPVDYKLPELPLVGSFIISKPGCPSMDFAGEVAATGRSDLKVGQRVFGTLEPPTFGALAEFCVVGKEGLATVPDGVSLKDASCVGVAGVTSYQCIVPNVKSGDKILINGGSGGTGTFGIQFAKAMGCSVVTTCSGPNVDLCKSLGADEVIDYRTQNLVDTLRRSGKQFDLIVDNAMADTNLYWQCHHYLKPDAKYITIAGTPSLSFIASMLQIFLLPTWLGGGQRKFLFLTAKPNAEDFAQIARWMGEGKVKAVIEETYALEDAKKAYEKLKTGRVRGNLVVEVSDK